MGLKGKARSKAIKKLREKEKENVNENENENENEMMMIGEEELKERNHWYQFCDLRTRDWLDCWKGKRERSGT